MKITSLPLVGKYSISNFKDVGKKYNITGEYNKIRDEIITKERIENRLFFVQYVFRKRIYDECITRLLIRFTFLRKVYNS